MANLQSPHVVMQIEDWKAGAFANTGMDDSL